MKLPGIKSLIVFKSLTVKNLTIEPKRMKADYELVLLNGNKSKNEFIYSYSDVVFDRAADSANLASIMGCQVALNYGLFCKEIIFDGLFDDTDKRFLLDMLENTSREIYVNKILQPNEFLTVPYKNIVVEKQKRYTAANITFLNTRFSHHSFDWEYKGSNRDSFVVLSSGGKDSLLSYGLLKELKKTVHPVFINESGRHWFTAINAYKHLTNIEPNTTKVWCNSDRIFNWILRYMPFISKDFNTIRADYYPIRLWTVSVFLFGVLPIARKLNAGNIIIGNEYDTTMRNTHEGITHYMELYDQSKYFDNSLTRYYTKKGWGFYQYSLLRSLSELLILKILVSRYPDLQQHQVSCHAAHKKEERIYPCGKCEKCRRIVAMLLALGESPGRCGYSDEQIDTSVQNLQNQGVKQIGSDAAHLFYLLAQKNILSKESPTFKLATAHPNIVKLRFDSERSSLTDVPSYIRKDLYSVLIQYADGAVSMENKKWRDINIFSSDLMQQPYQFEIVANVTDKTEIKNECRWELHTWPELQEKLKIVDTAILPCGSIEQHGPHLPLDVDYFDSVYLANKVAEACGNPKPFVLPAIPYGVAYHHEDFKGTVSISNTALSSLVYDLGISLAKNGIKKLIILNGHGDNAPTLLYAAQMINRDTGIFVCVETGETSDMDINSLIETPNDIHAGEIETSTTMAIRPELVQSEKAVNETMNFGSTFLDFSSERGVSWYVRTKILSESGIMGNPKLASAEKGKLIWEIMIANLVRFVEEVKKSNLEDLFQRKY